MPLDQVAKKARLLPGLRKVMRYFFGSFFGTAKSGFTLYEPVAAATSCGVKVAPVATGAAESPPESLPLLEDVPDEHAAASRAAATTTAATRPRRRAMGVSTDGSHDVH